ncbi:hypothetical protein [Dyadobacter sp. Leaf189]|uniref:hypothetical protein n=1 Tax=Dyadobacter sp. Leaf189 TaxID=1736295 RepID=UPI0006F6AFB8|nr:hypothetical protein [Dyadobacter sp. Leaf189]KQS34211.1 hypothetical protein ASG33_09390 [Dyadobacter sp. Leaf189]
MNSSEQKDFEHATPTDDEVNDMIRRLQEKLADAGTGNELAEAYEKAIRILKGRETEYNDLMDDASPAASRTIAALALRYLNGETGADVLLNYPPIKQ